MDRTTEKEHVRAYGKEQNQASRTFNSIRIRQIQIQIQIHEPRRNIDNGIHNNTNPLPPTPDSRPQIPITASSHKNHNPQPTEPEPRTTKLPPPLTIDRYISLGTLRAAFNPSPPRPKHASSSQPPTLYLQPRVHCSHCLPASTTRVPTPELSPIRHPRHALPCPRSPREPRFPDDTSANLVLGLPIPTV